MDSLTSGLVVQADIAANHGHSQDTARLGHATDAPLKLVIDLRFLWVAKIEAVGKGHRFGAGARQIAANLGHGYLAAPEGSR